MSREQNLAVAQSVTLKPIEEIAARLFLSPQYLEPYGRFKAKIALEALSTAPPRPGKLILVSAINPTPAGEGKTTTTVGLGQALAHLGKKTDDHANQIFIVNAAPRQKISTTTTPGTNWDDAWHHVKIVRRVADGPCGPALPNVRSRIRSGSGAGVTRLTPTSTAVQTTNSSTA